MRNKFRILAIMAAITLSAFLTTMFAAGAPGLTPFAVKSVKFTGDTQSTRVAYLQSAIEGELLKQGMLVKNDGLTMEIVTTWTEPAVGTMRALTITARLFRAENISYSIAVKAGGGKSVIQPPALNDEKYLIDEAAKLFVTELQKQVTAQRQALQIAGNNPRIVSTASAPAEKK